MTAKQCEMLKKINEVSFAMTDAQLFLDTHPCSGDAMRYFEKMRILRSRLMAEYAEMFTPLTVQDASEADSWSWVEGPWPWQYEANIGL